jgi:hypothetical protein
MTLTPEELQLTHDLLKQHHKWLASWLAERARPREATKERLLATAALMAKIEKQLRDEAE